MSDISGSGLTYQQAEEIIEEIATQKAYQHRRVGYYDLNDLKQEVRIKCWAVLPRYDKACGADLRVFLSVCAENRIRDIRRSVLYKHNRPCFVCPFWNESAAQSGLHDCLVFNNKMECEKYAKHERYVQAKLSASHPIDIDNERIEDDHFDKMVYTIDFIDHIQHNLPSGLLVLFDKLLYNNFNLKCFKPKERTIMISALREALKGFEG